MRPMPRRTRNGRREQARLAPGRACPAPVQRRRTVRPPPPSSSPAAVARRIALTGVVDERRDAGDADCEVDVAVTHGRPNVSEMMTATSMPMACPSARECVGHPSGSTGSRHDLPLFSTFDMSTPAFAQTKPWRVSEIMTPCSTRTMRLVSPSTTSMWRASLSHVAAYPARTVMVSRLQHDDAALGLRHDLLRDDEHVARLDDEPGARAASTPRAGRSSPARTSGMPARPMMRTSPITRPRDPDTGVGLVACG